MTDSTNPIEQEAQAQLDNTTNELGSTLRTFVFNVIRDSASSNNNSNNNNNGDSTNQSPFTFNNGNTTIAIATSSGSPRKQKAEKAAKDVRKVDPSKIKSSENSCPICYEPYKGVLASDESPLTIEERLTERLLNSNSDPAIPLSIDSAPSRNSLKFIKIEDSSNKTVSAHFPVKLPCNHIFGKPCIEEWLVTNSSCPLCRKEVPDSLINLIKANPKKRSFVSSVLSSNENKYGDPSIPFEI